MRNHRRWVVGLGGLILGGALLGCGAEESRSVGDPVEITPGMEKMKQEMIKAFQTKSLGKVPDATKK